MNKIGRFWGFIVEPIWYLRQNWDALQSFSPSNSSSKEIPFVSVLVIVPSSSSKFHQINPRHTNLDQLSICQVRRTASATSPENTSSSQQVQMAQYLHGKLKRYFIMIILIRIRRRRARISTKNALNIEIIQLQIRHGLLLDSALLLVLLTCRILNK